MDNSHILAKRIKQLAKERNLTVKDLLIDAEIKDKDFLGKIENGTNVGYINIVKIAEHLNCSVDYLLGRTDTVSVSVSEEKPIRKLEGLLLDKELTHIRKNLKNKNNLVSMKAIANKNHVKVKKKVKV